MNYPDKVSQAEAEASKAVALLLAEMAKDAGRAQDACRFLMMAYMPEVLLILTPQLDSEIGNALLTKAETLLLELAAACNAAKTSPR